MKRKAMRSAARCLETSESGIENTTNAAASNHPTVGLLMRTPGTIEASEARREQWISFYTAAPTGHCGDLNPERADIFAEQSADLAMVRLDSRTFPKPKVAALLEAANAVCGSAVEGSGAHLVENNFMALLRKTIGGPLRPASSAGTT
jgi:hypothetical protein